MKIQRYIPLYYYRDGTWLTSIKTDKEVEFWYDMESDFKDRIVRVYDYNDRYIDTVFDKDFDRCAALWEHAFHLKYHKDVFSTCLKGFGILETIEVTTFNSIWE